ncbi:MAG: YkgJ family cysteine cluster protein [Candidatus Bathyarchaeota archaeon]|nr:YkgJ family cysteine cluster protein [Candidatus Bathyarchaeota archaeon]
MESKIAGARMRSLPWSQVKSWRCILCGICCRKYSVVLKFPEWLSIIKRFGVEYTAPSITNFFLKRRNDGSCVFLKEDTTTSFCSLQYEKPIACKLWPFKVHDHPKYGQSERAVYYRGSKKLFVYVDPACPGLAFGPPTQEFTHSVIPEFIEIASGLRRRQHKTTANLWYR